MYRGKVKSRQENKYSSKVQICEKSTEVLPTSVNNINVAEHSPASDFTSPPSAPCC